VILRSPISRDSWSVCLLTYRDSLRFFGILETIGLWSRTHWNSSKWSDPSWDLHRLMEILWNSWNFWKSLVMLQDPLKLLWWYEDSQKDQGETLGSFTGSLRVSGGYLIHEKILPACVPWWNLWDWLGFSISLIWNSLSISGGRFSSRPRRILRRSRIRSFSDE